MTSQPSDQRSAAFKLAAWASRLQPDDDDFELATSALRDTVVVAIAARHHPLVSKLQTLPESARWTVAGHVLDFDDLHLPSTSHISAVCVPAVVANGGDARAYLAAAGVMARLGSALGWQHYAAGWHATCTAGAPAAAVGAGVALGLDANQLATAMALAVPGAGGVQRAFGTDAKSLQVGFAVEAGIRAARLAAAGASADPAALDDWLTLMGVEHFALETEGPTIPGGLAVKLFPCCYALQRPLSALTAALRDIDAALVDSVVVRTSASSVTPLIHKRPTTGLQGKFSLEYAVATALLDEYQGFASFSDEAVRRPEAQRLMNLVRVELEPDGGDHLLTGEFQAEVWASGSVVAHARLKCPPGAPQRPATAAELEGKFSDCLDGVAFDPTSLHWNSAADILRRYCRTTEEEAHA